MGTQCSTVHCTATSFLVKFKPFIRLPTKISHRDDQKRRGGDPAEWINNDIKNRESCCVCIVHVP